MRNLFYLLFLLVCLSITCKDKIIDSTPIDPYPSDNLELVFNDTFEQNEFRNWTSFDGPDENFIIQSRLFHSPNFSCEISILPEEKRNEMVKIGIASIGTEWIYKWHFMIDPAFEDSSLFTFIHQFHDYPNFDGGQTWENMHGRRPPLLTMYTNNQVFARISDSLSTSVDFGPIKIKKGTWNQMIYHVFWSTNNDGFISVALNGKFLTPFNGVDYKYYAPTLFNDEGNYFKIGLYRQYTASKTNKMYLDDFEFYKVLPIDKELEE